MANRILDEELRSDSGYSLQKLRTRITRRVRHPCTGRFDPCLDIQSDFEKDCREFKQLLRRIGSSVRANSNSADEAYLALDYAFLEDSIRFVHEKWEAQDKAMFQSRNPSPCVHPPSQTYFS